MSSGGGFCELHGPFDPPHLECPYCVMERQQREAYGPPAEEERGPEHEIPTDLSIPIFSDNPMDSAGFVRQTVEPPPRADVTEIIQRDNMAAPRDDERPLLGYLIVKEPPAQRGACLPIRANQSIGREGDVRWNDPRLSRQHARFTVEPPEDDPEGRPVFHLWPFGPTNPVYINGRSVRGATPIYENDEIRLGDTLFVLKVVAD